MSSLKQVVFSNEFDKFVEDLEKQKNFDLYENGYTELFPKRDELASTLLRQFGISDGRIPRVF
jgi:hypothetical protein